MKKKTKAPFVNFVIFLMFCTCIYLGMKINEKKQWVQLPVLSAWFPYENWFKESTMPVDNKIEYHLLSGNFYTNGSNQAVSVSDGIVLDVSEDQVIILNDNAIETTYGSLSEILVKVDERILKGQGIAAYKDSLSLVFKKNGTVISYEDALQQ